MIRTRPFSEILDKINANPMRREQVATYKRAMRAAMAIAEVLEAMGVSQATISRIEHEEDLYLSTLRGYVEALGGKLEVNVVFPDATVTLIAAER